MAWWPGTLRFLRRRRVFTAYVLAGSLAILMIVGWGAYRLAGRVEQQAQLSTWLLSHFASVHLGQGQGQGQGGGLQEVLLRSRELDVPFIVTDNQDRPLLWNSPVVGIPMPDSLEALARVNPAGGNGGDLDRILDLVREYDARNEPFAITDPRTGQRVMTLHYGASALGRQIRWLPYAELALLAVFFLLIVWALSLQREGHEQKLFAGMAKETAHQLGTPITSIMGWLEILRDRRPDDIVEELGRDVARLGKVSERFSQIGSHPQLADTDLAATVAATVVYFRRRLPHLGGHVEIGSRTATPAAAGSTATCWSGCSRT
jgi:signal transduction histidine kinase